MAADVSELQQLADDLRKGATEAREEIKGKTTDTAERVYDRMLHTTAFQDVTGDLRRSFKLRRARLSARTATATITVDQFYGRFLEDGTTRAKPHPFIAPALEAEADAFAASVDEVVQKLI